MEFFCPLKLLQNLHIKSSGYGVRQHGSILTWYFEIKMLNNGFNLFNLYRTLQAFYFFLSQFWELKFFLGICLGHMINHKGCHDTFQRINIKHDVF